MRPQNLKHTRDLVELDFTYDDLKNVQDYCNGVARKKLTTTKTAIPDISVEKYVQSMAYMAQRLKSVKLGADDSEDVEMSQRVKDIYKETQKLNSSLSTPLDSSFMQYLLKAQVPCSFSFATCYSEIVSPKAFRRVLFDDCCMELTMQARLLQLSSFLCAIDYHFFHNGLLGYPKLLRCTASYPMCTARMGAFNRILHSEAPFFALHPCIEIALTNYSRYSWKYQPEYEVVRTPLEQDLYVEDAEGFLTCDSSLQFDDVDQTFLKYWYQRYRLFSRFDRGILLNREGFYSVTPEAIAIHQAYRMQIALQQRSLDLGEDPDDSRYRVVDLCCGPGGNAIQLALLGFQVTAVDINAKMLRMARKNAEIYGVRDRIDFVHMDLFEWCSEQLRCVPGTKKNKPLFDAVFMSPPWGGPTYSSAGARGFSLLSVEFESLQPQPTLLRCCEMASRLSHCAVTLFLPKKTLIGDIFSFQHAMYHASPLVSQTDCKVNIEMNMLYGKTKGMTVYFGSLANFNCVEEDDFLPNY